MTIQEVTPRVSYVGDAIQDVFSFAFPLVENSDLEVTIDGVLQTEITHYTIENLGDSGGDVDFITPPADLTAILILRNTELDQETAYTAFGPFPAKSHEGALDKLTMQLQDQADRIDNLTINAMEKDPSLTFWEAEGLVISNLLDPVADQDAATKVYVDSVVSVGDLQAAEDETITGEWTFASMLSVNADLVLGNDVGKLRGKETGGTERTLAFINTSDEAVFGNPNIPSEYRGLTYNFSGGIATFASQVIFDARPIIFGLLWPTGIGNDGQVLTTDGAANLRWASVGAGGIGTDPLADETITGQWTFNQTILGTTSGNLVPGDLATYPEKQVQETITAMWTFDVPIVGSTTGNVLPSEITDFAQKSIAQTIVGNWDFTQDIKFRGVTLEAPAGQLVTLSMDIVAGPQGVISNGDTNFQLLPDGVPNNGIVFDQATKHWNFLNDSVIIKPSAEGGLFIKGIASGSAKAAPNQDDDITIGGEYTFSQTIIGTCSGNISLSDSGTVTGLWKFATSPIALNAIGYSQYLNGNIVSKKIANIGTDDVLDMFDGLVTHFNMATASLAKIAGNRTLEFVDRVNGSLLVDDAIAVQHKVGFRDPSRKVLSGTANYTAIQADEGQPVEWPAGSTFHIHTIDDLGPYTILTIYNKDTVDKTINEAVGFALNWLDGSGVAKGGDRTLAGNSVITIHYNAAGTGADVWGNGLS